jgi:hypothetical protein
MISLSCRLMIPLPVIVFREGHERATEMRLPQNYDTVQAFFFHGSDEPFGVGIAIGRRVGRLDHVSAERQGSTSYRGHRSSSE